jgi:hypothetical protein
MESLTSRPVPVNPDPVESADRAAWSRDCRRAEDFGTLLAWAQSTLPAEVLPCRCVDGSCLRCETARVVAEWEAPADSGGVRNTPPEALPSDWPADTIDLVEDPAEGSPF